jgi:lipopolysaccharide export system permease protein
VFPLFGLLNRMIFWELVKVFLLSLIGLTGLFLVAGLIQQASQLGLSPSQVLNVIPLLIPSTLPYTIPATTLFASCVVYGRVANDNEAVAMKAAGVDLLNILRPALALGVLTTLVTGTLYYSVIPRTQQMLQEEVMKDPEEVLYNQLRRERRLVSPTSAFAIYVRDVQGRRLIDVVVKRRSAPKPVEGLGTSYWEYDYIARTREARLVVDLEKRTLTVDADRWVVAGKSAWLESEGSPPEAIKLPDMFDPKQIKSRPMALEWDELGERFGEFQAKRDKLSTTRAEHLRQSTDPATHPKIREGLLFQDRLFEDQIKETTRQMRNVEYEYYIRPALAVSCFCFALIGCPVGIWANRADYLSTFVTCFLPAVFIYYPLLLSGGGLAKDGKVPMVVGVWGANAIAGAAALLLTFRLIKR